MQADLFVDTSAWFPIAVRSHPDHDALARRLRRAVEAGEQIVTTNLIVAETHALLLRRVHRRAALAFVCTVSEPPNLVIRSSEELERSAVTDWLSRHADHDFSLADAVSFAVMSARGIDSVLALDRNFAAAGFQVMAG
jgi:predicted nucleic acid-binding protein